MLASQMSALIFLISMLLIANFATGAPLPEEHKSSEAVASTEDVVAKLKRDVASGDVARPEAIIKILKKKEAPVAESEDSIEKAETEDAAEKTIDREKRRSNKKSKSRKNG